MPSPMDRFMAVILGTKPAARERERARGRGNLLDQFGHQCRIFAQLFAEGHSRNHQIAC